jgi:ABC-type sugar transport system ATPase subunit
LGRRKQHSGAPAKLIREKPEVEVEKVMTKEPFLKAVGIRKEFPGVLALNDVSIECYPGETLGVLGENGAGKSTLMKVFTGMYHPDKGDLFVDGEKLNISSPAFAQRQGISMVYQDTRLVPDLTVMQNIWLGHEPSKLSFVNNKSMLWKTNELLKEFKDALTE